MKQLLLNYKQRKPCVNSQSVLLIIVWDTLMYADLNLMRYFAATVYIDSHVDHEKVTPFSLMMDTVYHFSFTLFWFAF